MAEVWDVVCGMKGDTDRWDASVVYQGKRYYFCCRGCRGAFERSPEYHLENFREEHPEVEPGLPAGERL